MPRAIALLTDFGLVDSYVGVMKGVMQQIAPGAVMIDLTHQNAPQNVRQAAFTLLNSVRYFPAGTVFLIVVDPGVGGKRHPIAVEAAGYTFIAPDNGVLSYILAELGTTRAHILAEPEYQLAPVSRTFHGRDIFAPAAAHVAAGVDIQQFGPSLESLVELARPRLEVHADRIVGEVLTIDHFGNIISSIGRLSWAAESSLRLQAAFGHAFENLNLAANSAQVRVKSATLHGIHPTYGASAPGDMLALVGSSGFLEVGVNHGSAARSLSAAIGDPFELVFGSE